MRVALGIAISISPNQVDARAPTITSPAAHSVNENAVYSATAAADESVSWAKGGADAALVTLNTATGEWSVPAQDFETKPSVSFTLTATDASGNASSPQTITLTIIDVAEFADPSFNDPAAWTVNAPVTITGGQYVYNATGAGTGTPVTAVPVTAGQPYNWTVNSATDAAATLGGFISLWDSTGTVNLSGWVQIYLGDNVFPFTPAASHANVMIQNSTGNGAYTLNSVLLVAA